MGSGLARNWRAWRNDGIVGHLDESRPGIVRGWVWLPRQPDDHLLVDVFVADQFAGQCMANLYRPDLEEAGIGDGRHAFQLNLTPDLTPVEPDSIRAFALLHRRYELSPPPAPVLREREFSAEEYLRANFASLLSSKPQLPRRGMEPPPGIKKYERLFGPSPVPTPPSVMGRPLPAYLDYIRHRHNVAREYDTTVAEEQYVRFLKYYLENYARRRGRLRAPLRADDIERLNLGPSANTPLASSLAQELLQSRPSTSATLFEKAFRWAAYESAAFGVEDCLIPAPQKDWLRACDASANETAYPLSRFMRRFLSGNPFLKALADAGEAERKIGYLGLLLFATTSPHFIEFMPERWVAQFLDGECSPFDETLRCVFGPCSYTREDWRARLADHGYDVETKRFRFWSANGDRVLSPAVVLTSDAPVDVQLIGPFSRRLGISDSCRALGRALEKQGVSTRFCDFAFDHPNDVRGHPDIRIAPIGRAHVNILHLNLEETPAAFAYLPDVFTGSRVIGMPYLETPKLEPTQLLGLSLLDEIWVASKFVADSIGDAERTHVVGSASKPLQRIGHAAARKRAYEGVASVNDFVFLTACDALSGLHRKNPLGVIRAFLHAFPHDDGVKLIIKSHSGSRLGEANERRVFDQIAQIAAQDSRIICMDRLLDDDMHAALIEGADVLVSLHRAEGFGYHILEAMCLGTPVIATAYSGNMDFCTDATACLVPFAQVNIKHWEYCCASPSQTWAEPDFAASVEAMRSIRCDPVAGRQMAERAKAHVEANCSPEAFASRVGARLQRILRDLRIRDA